MYLLYIKIQKEVIYCISKIEKWLFIVYQKSIFEAFLPSFGQFKTGLAHFYFRYFLYIKTLLPTFCVKSPVLQNKSGLIFDIQKMLLGAKNG